MSVTGARAGGPDSRWWREEEDGRVSSAVTSALERISKAHGVRHDLYRDCLRMYGGNAALGFWADETARVDRAAVTDTLSWNVIANVVDTLQAEVVQSRPRPMFLSVGGDYSLRQRVKKLNRFVEGLFETLNVDALARDVCLDALIFGIGVAHVYTENGRVHVDRVLPTELFVDSVDGRYRKPRTLYRVRYVDRSVLQEQYPERFGDLGSVSTPAGDWALDHETESDCVLLVEAWHLPSGVARGGAEEGAEEKKRAIDGRYVATVLGLTGDPLREDEWTDETFPFVALRWKILPIGWHGQGVVEQLIGLQIDINCTLDTIQQLHMWSTARVLVEGNSRVVADHVNDEHMSMIRYFGTAPTVVNWQMVNPETYQWVETQWAKAFQVIGVSQLSAQGLKPSGVTAAVAMRTMLDTQSKRFIRFAKDYEDWHVELGKQIVREMVRNAEADSSFDVVYTPRGRAPERISWADAYKDLTESSYVVQCFPVSALPTTPGAKMEALQEWFKIGAIGVDQLLELMDFPDFESQRTSLVAPRELAELRVEIMLADGEYLPPEPFFDLPLHVKVCGLAYQKAVMDGATHDRLAIVRDYIAACLDLIKQASAPPAPPQLPPGAAPTGDVPPPMPGPGGPIPPGGPMPPVNVPPMAA